MRDDSSGANRAWLRPGWGEAVRLGSRPSGTRRSFAASACSRTPGARCSYGGRGGTAAGRGESVPPAGTSADPGNGPEQKERQRPSATSLPADATAGGGTELIPYCRVVRYEGELDLENVASFGAGLRVGSAGAPRPQLVVDLSDVTFMDGSPLRELCATGERAERKGGWVRVVYQRRSIGLLFRASGLSEKFPRHATVEDARDGRSSPTAA